VYGISGDLPIVLVRIDEADDIDIVRQLLRAHEYWRLKLLDVDLVIINEHGVSYAQDLQDALETIVRTSQSTLVHERHDAHGGVHILRGDQLSTDERTLLQSAARAVLLSRRGSLADQVIRWSDRQTIRAPERPARAVACRRRRPPPRSARRTPRPGRFFNAWAAFAGGREKVGHRPGDARPG
jgi:cyclic beta-1,2-glucan synthetase